ncbi:MAG: DUF6431 domain-containing protein [Oscillospiraceae bacterium]|nr:DUF6431 domain-containing protein [Oscillospiraceae bacterium]
MRSNEAGYCPICGEALIIRGERQRKLITGIGNKVTLVIRRLKCEKCKRIHHELPDCIVPYKRHCAETIEAIVSGKPDGFPCGEALMRRIAKWWKVVSEYYLNILKSLAEKYQITFCEPPQFKELVRAAANTNNWISPKTICTRTELKNRRRAC